MLRPERVGWIEALEVRDEPRAVELAVAEVSHQRGEPAAAQQAARCSAWGSAAARLPSRTAASPRR